MTRRYTQRVTTPRMIAAAKQRDALAEHVANEGSLAGFAREHGLSERYAQKVWRGIREALGAQAV